MLVSASDWLKLIFEKVCGFAYIKITLSTNLDMHNRFQGSFCCDLPLQDPNLVSASGGMVTAAFDRFFDESTQLAYFLYKLCTLTLIDAFLSNVLAILENT